MSITRRVQPTTALFIYRWIVALFFKVWERSHQPQIPRHLVTHTNTSISICGYTTVRTCPGIYSSFIRNHPTVCVFSSWIFILTHPSGIQPFFCWWIFTRTYPTGCTTSYVLIRTHANFSYNSTTVVVSESTYQHIRPFRSLLKDLHTIRTNPTVLFLLLKGGSSYEHIWPFMFSLMDLDIRWHPISDIRPFLMLMDPHMYEHDSFFVDGSSYEHIRPYDFSLTCW